MVTTCLMHFLYCTHFWYNINSLEPLLIFYIALLIFLKVCNIDFQILSCKMVDNDWMYINWNMLQYFKTVIFILKVKKLAFISFSSSRMNQKQETYIQEVASLLTKLFRASRALLQRHAKNDFFTCYSCSFVVPCSYSYFVNVEQFREQVFNIFGIMA